MGLFTFIGGLLGAGSQKRASRKAEAAQLQYLDKALTEQGRQFDLTRSDYQPYLNAGKSALGDIGDIVGINGDTSQMAALAALQNSPYLQSLIRNGEEGVLQNASATGGLRGGNIQRDLADFRADAFSEAIQRQLQNLGGLAGMGQGATYSVSMFGANKANAISNLYGQQGAVRAGGLLTRGGINAGMWNNGGAFLDNAVQAALGAGLGSPGGFNIGNFAKSFF